MSLHWLYDSVLLSHFYSQASTIISHVTLSAWSGQHNNTKGWYDKAQYIYILSCTQNLTPCFQIVWFFTAVTAYTEYLMLSAFLYWEIQSLKNNSRTEKSEDIKYIQIHNIVLNWNCTTESELHISHTVKDGSIVHDYWLASSKQDILPWECNSPGWESQDFIIKLQQLVKKIFHWLVIALIDITLT